MNKEDLYMIIIEVFTLNLNFESIFSYVEQPYLKEILDFIDFVKKNPNKESISEYNLSFHAKNEIKLYLDYVIKKIVKNIQ